MVRSEIREHDTRAYRALANDRRALPPYRDRRIQVRTHLTSGEAVFVIKDDGRGFDPGRSPIRHAPRTSSNRPGEGCS